MSRRTKAPLPAPLPVSYALDMTATRWSFRAENSNCVGCPACPTTQEPLGHAWSFIIPRFEDNPLNKVGYVQCAHTIPITASKLEGTFHITASLGTTFSDGKEPYNDATPASVGFCITTADFYGEFGRWWGKARVSLESLQPWPRLLTVPLVPEAWQNMNGKPATDYPLEFKAALAAPAMICLTFGAGGDFGHGIRTIGGYATFNANDIRVT